MFRIHHSPTSRSYYISPGSITQKVDWDNPKDGHFSFKHLHSETKSRISTPTIRQSPPSLDMEPPGHMIGDSSIKPEVHNRFDGFISQVS